MADYYPLISRAVANLGPSTPEQRRDLYTRATNALIGQLRNSDPPIPETDITRERLALEDAIGRVETEVAGGLSRQPDGAAPTPVPAQPSPTASPPPTVALPPEPPAPVREPEPPSAPESSDWAAAEPLPPPAAMSAPQPAGPDGSVVEPEPAEPVTPERVEPVREMAAGRPRPPAPRLEAKDRRWVRAAVIGVAIAVVVGLTATAAIMLKHQPSDFQPQQPFAAAPQDAERKGQDRLPGEAPPVVAAAPVPVPAPAAPATPAAPSAASPAPAAPAATPPDPATVGILQRVLLVEEPEQGSREFKQTPGRVRWRLDTVSGGAGQPLDSAVRADIEVPEAGLKVDALIRKNRDAALPASHTLELRFTSSASAPNGPVRDVGVPEMRQDETMRGTPLVGIAVPVTENLFLTGLSNLGGDVQRNLDLLKTRNWFMVPVRYTNGRRALLLIEKGPTGTRAIADAIQAWQQG